MDCKWCDAGDEPSVLDRDGVQVEISGQPGLWAHAHEDSWWPCQRKAAEEHAEIERLQTLRLRKLCDCNHYGPELSHHDRNCHWRVTIEDEAAEAAASRTPRGE